MQVWYIVIFCIQIKGSVGCYGYDYGYGYGWAPAPTPEPTRDGQIPPEGFARTTVKDKHHNVWTVDPGVQNSWEKWYWHWMQEQKALKQEAKEAAKAVDGDDPTEEPYPSLPPGWEGLPPGRGAEAVPPWASFAHGEGKPNSCFQPPMKGGCNLVLFRWGYNPFLNACSKFVYSGCGGNVNNFISEKRCKEVCGSRLGSNCETFGRRTILEGRPGC